jgi:hypothetical protein
MRKAEILTALGFIGFAIAVIVQARQVGSGWAGGQPQSGFFPFWLALFLGIGGLVILGQTLLGSKEAASRFFHSSTAAMSVLKVMATAGLALVLTYLIDFYTAAVIYMFIYTRFVGRHRWPAVIVMSVFIPVGSYVLFERTLQILLPRGIYSGLSPFK